MITTAESPYPPDSCGNPVAEFLDMFWVGRRPIELGSSLGRNGALIEQEDFGEIVA